jgi:hypothetical protein
VGVVHRYLCEGKEEVASTHLKKEINLRFLTTPGMRLVPHRQFALAQLLLLPAWAGWQELELGESIMLSRLEIPAQGPDTRHSSRDT